MKLRIYTSLSDHIQLYHRPAVTNTVKRNMLAPARLISRFVSTNRFKFSVISAINAKTAPLQFRTMATTKYQTIERGVPNSLDYRVFLSKLLSKNPKTSKEF